MRSSLFSSIFILVPLVASVRVTRRSHPNRLARAVTVDPTLVPEFGVVAGIDPTGTGNCEGVNGIAIPCSCPPDRDLFIQDLELNLANGGRALNNSGAALISFPTGADKASVLARLSDLQNFLGLGVGCPQASTTFGAQVTAAEALPDTTVASTTAVVAAATVQASLTSTSRAASSTVSSAIDVFLIPEFGIVAGQDPTGTGNCAGVSGIAIPCTCPPDRNLFIADLNANVLVGHAVNNTAAAAITFPTGSDKASVLARLTASTITLQNLFGAGVGCPQAATTFGAQITAAEALPN